MGVIAVVGCMQLFRDLQKSRRRWVRLHRTRDGEADAHPRRGLDFPSQPIHRTTFLRLTDFWLRRPLSSATRYSRLTQQGQGDE